MAKIDKLLEQAKAHLEADEQVAAAVQGQYETKILGSDTVRTGILIATNTRIVFYAKKMGGYDLESFHYGNVSSFEQSKGMMGHSVSFFASGNKASMKWVSDKAAMQRFTDEVKTRLNPANRAAMIPGTNVTQQPQASAETASDDKASIIDAIKQLGELHQAGVLDEQEFSAKKAELLARL